jgi:hypothetical protein
MDVKSVKQRRRRTRSVRSVNYAVSNAVQPLEKRVLFNAFYSGDLVVYRVGDGSAALSSNSTAVFLDEYTPAGQLVQSIPLPTTAGAGATPNPLTASGTATSEGQLTLSQDGQNLLLTGYDTGLGTASITSSSSIVREVGVVNASGGVNTTTTLGSGLESGSIYSAASVDGVNGVYAAGTKGIVYTTVGNGSSVSLTASYDYGLNVNSNQLYATGDSSTDVLSNFSTGLPTTTGQTLTNLPGVVFSGTSGAGVGYSREFAFATLNGGSAPDTLYVADAYNDGVDKLSLVNGSWVLNGEIGAYVSGQTTPLTGVEGVIAEPTAGGEQLYITATTGGVSRIYSVVDSSGYDSASSSIFTATPTLTTVATAGANEAFRGIEFTPQPAGTLAVALNPTNQTAVVGTTATFTAAAYGQNVSVQWEVNSGSGFTPISGATSDTLTVPNVTTSESGYQYEAVFTNAAGTKTTTPATLTVVVAPLLNFDAATYSVLETAGSETIQVDRGGSTTTAVNVNFTVGGGTGDTAVAGTNYGSTGLTVSSGTVSGDSGTLMFPANVTSETITIPIKLVSPQGGNKTFTVTLSSPTAGGQLQSPASTVVTIVDTGEVFNLSDSTYSVDDTATTAFISVVRTGNDTTDAGSVPYTVTGAVTASGSVNFSSGQIVSDIQVPVPASTGANQTFTVTLGNGFTGFTGTPTLGTLTTATETVVHAPATNVTSTTTIFDNTETTGQYETGHPIIVGDPTTTNPTQTQVSFNEFTELGFSPSASPGIYPAPGFTVTNVSNLSLSLYTPTDAAYHPTQSGNFNVYYIPDNNPADTAYTFNTAIPTGLDSTQFTAGAPILLGTFSFTGSLQSNGQLATYTPATLSPTVANDIKADLNNQTPFRFALTPTDTGVGAIEVRFAANGTDGNGVNEAPALSLGETQTQVSSPETFMLASSSVSAYENAGAETINVTRSGAYTGDTATASYSLTNGSALAGTNYGTAGNTTPITGTVNFAANQTTATISIPLINSSYEDGDKFLTLTLTGATTGNTNASTNATTPVLAAPTSATVTIQDTSTAPTETLSPSIYDAADVEADGPYSDTIVKATALSGAYPSYGVLDFTPSTPSNTITAIDNATLTVTNAANGDAGNIDIYLVADSTSNISVATPQAPNPHFYNASAGIEGIGTQFGATYLLGSYQLTDITSGDTINIPLGYTSAAEAQLVAALNNTNSNLRLVITPEDKNVDADFSSLSASLSVEVQEGTVSSLPAWVSPNSQATFSNNTLTLSGPTTIIGNPANYSNGTVAIVASGSSDVLTVAVPAGTEVQIGSLSLTNGAVTTLNGSSGALLATSGLSIDATSQLDLGNGFLDVVGGSLSSITSEVAMGYSNGQWTGAGITSSTAAMDSTHLTALGVIQNNQNGTAVFSGSTTFDGTTPGASDILVRYTYYGDTNLDGKVDGSDYSRIDNGDLNHLTGWFNGDFNYDSTLNGSDYTLIDNAYNRQGPAIVAAQIAAATPANTYVATPVNPTTSITDLFSKKKVFSSLVTDDLITH